MAFDAASQENGFMAEINVTPLVDVMLVLLIIFMVTAPMMTQGIEVDLPEVDTQAMRADNAQVVVSLAASGRIFIDEVEVAGANLGPQVKAVMTAKNAAQVFLRADKAISYGQVARVMGQIRQAGVLNLGLVTEPEAVSEPGEKRP